MSRRLWVLGVVLAVSAGVIVHLWTALHWTENFGSDEAVFGLMAKHILDGRIPTYRYGLNYLGSLESLLAAPFLAVLGPSVPSLRLSSILLYAVAMFIHALLVRRHWGASVSLVSTLVLALPARWVLEWTYRPMGFSTILVFGPAALLLAGFQVRRRPLHLARLAGIGGLAGLAWWSNPSTLLYFGVLGAVAWLGTEEWRATRDRLTRLGDRLLGGAAGLAVPTVALAGVGLGTAALFSAGCGPTWSLAAGPAKAALALGLLAMVVLTIAVPGRRAVLLQEAGALALGLFLGALPVWRAWLFYDAPPANPVLPSCLNGVPQRAQLVFGALVPALWGAEPVARLGSMPGWEVALWLAVATAALTATVAFVLRERAALGGLLTAAPVTAGSQPAMALALLLALPVYLALLGANTIDITATRYLMISWQAGAVLLAVFLVRLLSRARWVGAVVGVLWLAQVGCSYGHLTEYWDDTYHWFAPEATTSLTRHLEENGVGGGYAGYWLSYVLTYMNDESIIIAPITGADRYPEYTRFVAEQPLRAFIFWPEHIPEEAPTTANLLRGLGRDDSGGPTFAHILDEAEGLEVVDRRHVGNWDVWLVREAR